MGETAIIWAIGIVLSIAAIAPYFLRQRRLEKKSDEAELKALKYGLTEPATLHPVINPEVCIGTGNCLADVCPEHDVLGIRNGQAVAISPARCVGHGLCERACPVDAIKLVFGTSQRGVDLPRIKSNYETNVDGIYVIGELGGMGLIRNAFEQGRQCIESIAKEVRPTPADALDVLIVGCGPAGLSASINCRHRNLSFATVEKEDVGGTVRNYPRKKLVMTSPLKIPGYGKVNAREIVKEDLMEIWEDIVRKVGLEVQTGETVKQVQRTDDGCFLVTTDRRDYKTMRVVLAIGRRGVPRKLGVAGEDLPKVAYALREPEAYNGDEILVVGGGDSAVEAALALADQPDNSVAISYRKDAFSRIKPGNLDRINKAAADGRIDIHWKTNVVAVDPRTVALKNGQVEPVVLDNDYVFVFIGGELPTPFLKSCGIEIDTKFGQPVG